jgi:uncharacterized protein YceK
LEAIMKSAGAAAGLALAALIAVPVAAAPQETVLYRFEGGKGGAFPAGGLIMDTSGALYGAAGGGSTGWGTVFKLTPPRAGETEWTQSVLYSFQGGTDGADPAGGLIIDTSGALYGMMEYGGAHCGPVGCGTVFKLTPPAAGQTVWTENVLYRFKGGTDGAQPVGSLILDASGALYGTTFVGGNNCSANEGCGTVFGLTPPAAGQTVWTESVLHRFQGGSDGAYPSGGVITDTSGALYGATGEGGTGCYGCGTVFKLTPPGPGETEWTESVLHSFQGGKDGEFPNAGLITDTGGALYGTTGSRGCSFFGAVGCGTVFKLTPPVAGQTVWSETLLYRFEAGRVGGVLPRAGLIMDTSGALYGTASRGDRRQTRRADCPEGCGTVFELTPPAAGKTGWTLTVLHAFQGGKDGADPFAGLIIDDATGTLFGTAGGGGGCSHLGPFGCGTVFQLVP